MSTRDQDSSLPSAHPQPTVWTGGVVRVSGLRHRQKPMRVAAWMTSGGSIIAAAVVEGHGPSALYGLFDHALRCTDEADRPDQIVVWPDAAKPFHGMELPKLEERRDEFLRIVVDDWIDAEMMHGGPVPVITV